MELNPTKHTLNKNDYISLSLLFMMSFFLFADQNLMGPNLTQIANDFGFDSTERDVKLGGEISLVFWLIGGFVTLFFGYFTDSISRKKLLIASILIGEIPCLLTGFVTTYTQFFWLRALTGIGIGAIIPITYSLLGDYFPANKRSSATAYLGLVVGLGIAGGQLLAGFSGPVLGWKMCFIIVAIPNFFVLLLYIIIGTEPKRGQSDKIVGIESINISTVKAMLSKKTNILIFLQGMAGTVPWAVFFVFLVDYLAQDIGYSIQAATLVVSVIGLSAMMGGFVGGIIGNKLYNINPRYQPLLAGLCTFIGMVPTAFLINLNPVDSSSPSIMYPIILGVFSGFFITVTAPNMKAILMNVNHPNIRGTAFALYNLADDLGRGFGPFIISFFILQFGRQWGFNLANAIWFICGIFILLMIKTYPKDQEGI